MLSGATSLGDKNGGTKLIGRARVVRAQKKQKVELPGLVADRLYERKQKGFRQN